MCSAERPKDDRFRAVFETAVDGMVIIDNKGIIKLINPAAEKLFGYSLVEIVGHNVTILMPEPYRSQHDGYLSNYHETGNRKIIGIGREVEGQRKDGRIFPMELAVGQIADGGDWSYVGVIRDVTERDASMRELTEARARAESANRAKTDFLAQMSHELRTPLNAILGYAQLLNLHEAGRSEPPQDAGYVDSIVKAATHLNGLIDDILELAKIDAGRHRVEIAETDLGEIVADAIMMTRAMASRFGVSILSKSLEPSNWPVVKADPMRLRQCLVNVLSNAIKYNRHRGRVIVDTGLSVDGIASLIIEDTGTGIAADKMEHLFQPFTRLSDRQHQIEGSGIGLSISKRLIEAMGGTIAVESEIDVGTRVTITLPALSQMAPRRDVKASPPAKTEKSATLNPTGEALRVLYVEDMPTNARLMEAFFSGMENWDLVTAESAERALALIAEDVLGFDCIILDVMLPGMDGFEAITRFRAIERSRGVPIIGLSALASSEDRELAAKCGFDRYMTKPFEFAKLARVLLDVTGKAEVAVDA
jgi:PAS domain S-box-containing protein